MSARPGWAWRRLVFHPLATGLAPIVGNEVVINVVDVQARAVRGEHRGGQLPLQGQRVAAVNLPASLRGWRADPAYIDAAHRVHARVEDAIQSSTLACTRCAASM